MKKLLIFLNSHLVFLIAFCLFLLPFFWIKPGEINIGGDGGSLYYYDPLSFVKYYILYKIYPYGTGPIEVRDFYLPFVSLLAVLRSLSISPYLLSVLHNSIKLTVGFISVYGIIKILFSECKELENNQENKFIIKIIALITGLFYIFSPMLIQDDRYINPIPSHDQIFLNPLVFYLILKYFLTKKIKYLWILLLITVIFAHGFSYTAVPAIFSFYPFAFLFIIFYVVIILKKTLPIKGISIGILKILHQRNFVPNWN